MAKTGETAAHLGAARLHSVRSGAARAFRRRDAPWGRLSVRTAPAAPRGRRRTAARRPVAPRNGPVAGDGATWPEGSRAASRIGVLAVRTRPIHRVQGVR